MENAANALKMAAAALIFIIAIGSSFSLFGSAKKTADTIITIRDKQSYLEAAELDNGILYTSSDIITSDDAAAEKAGVTTSGDRIVSVNDVISTIYRYSKEKYGVTIMDTNGNIIARYDSNTDQIMTLWDTKKTVTNADGTTTTDYIISAEAKSNYANTLKNNTKNDYLNGDKEPQFDVTSLEGLFKMKKKTGHGTEESPYTWVDGSHAAPWYGNETEIRKKIGYDLTGGNYECNGYQYTGKNLLNALNDKKIVEVTNEIDNSKYLKQTDDEGNVLTDDDDNTINSDLLQQYEMPTIEIVYIILD